MMQIKDPEAPATDSQISYLESLLAQRDNRPVAERYRLMKTLGAVQKGQASEWIDSLLASPKKTVMVGAFDGSKTSDVVTYAKQDAAATIAALELKPQLTEMPAFGYYMINDTVYYWDCTGKDAYPQLRKLIVGITYSGAKKGTWKKIYGSYNDTKVTATWKPYGAKSTWTEKTGLVRIPKALTDAVLGSTKPLTQDEAGKLGKQFGFCVRCGATLTDPVSVANGIGPVCAKYWA